MAARGGRIAQMAARGERIAVLAALALLCAALLPGAALAGIVGVAPSDSQGPNQDFVTNDALWAVGVSNVFSGVGQLCVVEQGAPVSGSCETEGFWGQPNAIGVVGTFQQPIVAPYLATGTYRILADNGGDGAGNVLSDVFTVGPCTEEPCTKDLAQGALDEWKAAAGAAINGPAAACFASTAYEVNGDLVSGATEFAAAGGSARAYLLSIVQEGQPELEFRTPSSSRDMAISVLQKVSCGAYLMYGDIIADPPDPDFRHLTEARPEPPEITSLVNADLAAASVEELRAEGVAQRVGVERYQGARNAGDAGWPALHAGRLGLAGLRMQRAMRRAVAPLRAYADELDADPEIAPASAGQVATVQAIRTRIRTTGFTSGELAELQARGLDGAQIAEIRADLGRPLPPGTPGTSPGTGLRAQADALEHASCGPSPRLCGFDEFSRLASAVGANAGVAPKITIADSELREGDRGVSHLHLRVRLSHPSETGVQGSLTLVDADAHAGVSVGPQFYFQAGRTETVVRVLVPGDTTAEADETLTLNVDASPGADPPAGPVTITVRDDDGGVPKPRPGARGLLAFTGPGDPSTYVAEPDGTSISRIFDDTLLGRLVVTDWSADGELMLMHRVPRTESDGIPLGAGYYALSAKPDGTTSGTPEQLTPEGTWHVGGRLSPDRRRLVSAQLGSPWWKLVLQRLTADGAKDGPQQMLGDDPVFAGWEVQFSVDWSPDGGRIVFDGCEAKFLRCGLYTLALDASGTPTSAPADLLVRPADRTFGGQGVADESLGAPSWSPDGRFVSFIRNAGLSSPQPRTTLERVPVNAAGTPTGPPVVLSTLTPSGGFYEASPDWSADSRAIAFYANTHPLTDATDPVDLVLELDADGLPAGAPTPLAPTLLSPYGWGAAPPVWGPPTPAPPAPPAPPEPPPAPPPAAAVGGTRAASPAPAVTAPAPLPALAAQLPSARRCISRRSFKIRLARPAGDPLVSAEVRVSGRKVRVIKGKRLTAPIDLRGLPKGKVKVSITAQTRSGRRLSAARTYTTCAPRKRR